MEIGACGSVLRTTGGGDFRFAEGRGTESVRFASI